MQQVMQQHGATRVVSGVYGQAGRATLVVLLAQGTNIETSTTQFFTDFTAGLKTQGVIVDRQDAQHNHQRQHLHLLTRDRPGAADLGLAVRVG